MNEEPAAVQPAARDMHGNATEPKTFCDGGQMIERLGKS